MSNDPPVTDPDPAIWPYGHGTLDGGDDHSRTQGRLTAFRFRLPQPGPGPGPATVTVTGQADPLRHSGMARTGLGRGPGGESP